jgi:hypothetical protein
MPSEEKNKDHAKSAAPHKKNRWCCFGVWHSLPKEVILGTVAGVIVVFHLG